MVVGVIRSTYNRWLKQIGGCLNLWYDKSVRNMVVGEVVLNMVVGM